MNNLEDDVVNIYQSKWNDFPAIVMENSLIRVVTVPQLGAKIVSLFDKTYQHEWLVPPMRMPKQTLYGANFVSQDMSGWDEMLPTIEACNWMGAHLPDHGEVWSIPWTLESAEEEVVVSVKGVAMPYRFSRSASFPATDRLQFHYSLTNTGQTDCSYLWAAHPQFIANSRTLISLPPEVTQMVNVMEGNKNPGRVGELSSWPKAMSAIEDSLYLDRVRPVENHSCLKLYVPPEQGISWAALSQDDLGCQLRLEWSNAELPYFGLWVDEGMYNAIPAVALEPSNGYYDSLERSIENQRIVILKPGENREWTVTLCFYRK
jgi:galactose mutarotase-like enzyme